MPDIFTKRPADSTPPPVAENFAAARATLAITNLILTGATASELSLINFSSYSYTITPTNSGTYDGGAPTTTTTVVSGTSANLPGQVFFSPADAGVACSGPACGSSFAVPPTALFSQGDSLWTGAPIVNLDVLTTPGIDTSAETSLNAAGHSGSASGSIVHVITFSLATTRTAGNFGFSFDAAAALRAWTDAASAAGTTATATVAWELKMTGPGAVTLIDWLPNGGTGTHTGLTVSSEGCNQNQTTTVAEGDPAAEITSSGHARAVTSGFTMLADTLYVITLTQTVTTSVATAS